MLTDLQRMPSKTWEGERVRFVRCMERTIGATREPDGTLKERIYEIRRGMLAVVSRVIRPVNAKARLEPKNWGLSVRLKEGPAVLQHEVVYVRGNEVRLAR